MSLCDPNRHRPVRSTGEPSFESKGSFIAPTNALPPARPPEQNRPPFLPVKCGRCGHTHNLHGDCLTPDVTITHDTRNHTLPETGKIPHFNSLEIQQLPQRIDGETEHLFLAFLNGRAVGSVKAFIRKDKACDVQALFVVQAERGKGIATRMLTKVEAFARSERATHLEISCNRGNVNARQFWIRRRFSDDESREAQPDPIRYVAMVRPL